MNIFNITCDEKKIPRDGRERERERKAEGKNINQTLLKDKRNWKTWIIVEPDTSEFRGEEEEEKSCWSCSEN